MKPFLNKLTPYFLPLLIMLFVLSRLGNLNLPFYWDEAWSYATAVFDMNENKLAILPGDANPNLTRGHPLLFYFLSAVWMKLFGTSLTAVHLFPLILSCITLVAVYIISKDLFSKESATIAVLLLALQSIFLAQSTLLLPEIMLALFTLLSFYFYFMNKWLWFSIFSIMLVMTKETGMVLIAALFLDKMILEKWFNKKNGRSWPLLIRELAVLCIPVIAFATFMMMQKLHFGWFLYPEHMGMTILDPIVILKKLNSFFFRLLMQHGKFALLVLALTGVIVLIRKKEVSGKQAHLLVFSCLFILLYMLFSAVNFFTTRYLLSVLPFFFICGAWIISEMFSGRRYSRNIIVVSLALLFAWHTFYGFRSEADVSLAYKNTVLLHKEVVHYAEEMQWQQTPLFTSFLMLYNLTDPNLGYLVNTHRPFSRTYNSPENDYEVYLYYSTEPDPGYSQMKSDSCCVLQKRFESRGAWAEFYVKSKQICNKPE
ncbi:MAG: glycosyltransferase family 39 protein [Bacteroidales bacterium]|nr:glycosyltransferase family 39 protein [Bacteroidales bacterium]